MTNAITDPCDSTGQKSSKKNNIVQQSRMVYCNLMNHVSLARCAI